MQAVIPCAGMGTRLLPITKCVPKELLAVYDKPAIQRVVEEVVGAGIREIILVCHPKKTPLIEHFFPNASLDRFLAKTGKTHVLDGLYELYRRIKIDVVYQNTPLGLGDAILCSRKAVRGKRFAVFLPDVIFPDDGKDTQNLLLACRDRGSWGILLQEMSKKLLATSGVVRLEGKRNHSGTMSILGAVEKPGIGKAPSRFGIIGRYLLPTEIFALLEAQKRHDGCEIELTTSLDRLAATNPGKGVVAKTNYFDVGTREGLVKANSHFWRQATKQIR